MHRLSFLEPRDYRVVFCIQKNRSASLIRMRSCPVSAVSDQLIFLLYRHLRHAPSGDTAIQMGDVLLECFLLSAFRHCSGEIPHRADRSRCGQSPFHQKPSFCLAAFNAGGPIIISPQKVIFFKLVSSLRPGRRIFCNHIIAPNKEQANHFL